LSIAENVQFVKEQIAEAARASGRRPEDVTLVAASKMNSADRVREAVAAGVEVCGENRVQELLEKDAQGAYADCRLHFIGHLQRNKAKHIVGRVELIQSVGSEELLRIIDGLAERRGIRQDVLIEVNIGREAAKTGVFPEELDRLLDAAQAFQSVRVRGLMAIPPADCGRDETRRFFSAMHDLFVDIKDKKYDNNSVQLLSMGMSGDYRDAIEMGANMVRVGTGIFGARDYTALGGKNDGTV